MSSEWTAQEVRDLLLKISSGPITVTQRVELFDIGSRYAATLDKPAGAVCSKCAGTGDLHDGDGMYAGKCDCQMTADAGVTDEAVTIQAKMTAGLEAEMVRAWNNGPHAVLDAVVRVAARHARQGEVVAVHQHRNICACPPNDQFCICNTGWKDVSSEYRNKYEKDGDGEWRTVYLHPPEQPE